MTVTLNLCYLLIWPLIPLIQRLWTLCTYDYDIIDNINLLIQSAIGYKRWEQYFQKKDCSSFHRWKIWSQIDLLAWLWDLPGFSSRSRLTRSSSPLFTAVIIFSLLSPYNGKFCVFLGKNFQCCMLYWIDHFLNLINFDSLFVRWNWPVHHFYIVWRFDWPFDLLYCTASRLLHVWAAI